jgi:hypothetical protein
MSGQSEKGMAILPTLDIIKISTVMTLTIIIHWLMRNTEVLQIAKRARWWVLAVIWATMVIGLIISQKSGDSFIYFQF